MMVASLTIMLAFVPRFRFQIWIGGRLDQEFSAFVLLMTSDIMVASGLAVGLINELRFARGHTGQEPSRLRLHLRRRGRSKRLLRTYLMKAAAETTSGLAIGIAIGLNAMLLYVWEKPERFWDGFTGGLTYGFEIGLAIGLSSIIVSALGDTNDPQDAISPWQLLATDRATTLIQTITTATAATLMLGYPWWTWSIQCGCVAGAVRLLLSPWGNWLLYVRLWLPLTGRLPWRPKRFLEDAYRRGALRQAGAIYQFRHAQLRNHLARHHRTTTHRSIWTAQS